MRRKIPSTAALVAFESAARHQSFTKAADELALTQSAVCRQIAGLEEFLGIELFRRSRRGVKLTEAGLAYSRKVAAQLDAVERDTLAAMGQQGAQGLELAVVPTFATQWLVPRLKEFQRLHPEVTVHLTNRTRPFLFADTSFDAAIYFGDGDWSGTEAHYLMPEEPLPVCSPELLGERTQFAAAELANLPLLQQSTRPYAWRQWFAAQGLNVPRDMSGPRYELFSMLAQAAMHGMGVALIPPFLIQRELDAGLLVPAHPAALLSSDRAYRLMIPERKVESAALRAFRDWLLQAAREYRGA
ncbi:MULTISPECIES: LysR family transcriptional regulator [Pseudomonadaceae]|jgi:DNA-binding transcriptional LysR family regulator|uniref:HTH-type transcriptional regulator TrpI n=1 Tax=Aquipseudomonas alcaligenes TaxID=43263 RepID=A0AA37CJ60_AQUAC|nr:MULTISPECIES: LysR family transcriptional regulator [Pseudomonas]MDC7825848.1 LysR family transcriptional regulator [Pseudomonas sp. BLCC-B13]NMY42193.1 LysR family transcriptional regulator [Pseudomonas sp. WS 5013]BCR22735.1 transcriptional regulator [Pseudomonas alcaligenes]GIZ67848.1 transcriptional regulator [Pseudomonas alcaligenes]GIZ72363.1 transcriptional regulator [Pseudomonas alcaligenes]